VAGQASLEDILKPTMVPKLWVVTTGQIPPNPSELLMHPRFRSAAERTRGALRHRDR
jgi:tyrosine-protein kinase Etk/Wzc